MDKQFYTLSDLMDPNTSKTCNHPLWLKFTSDKKTECPNYCVCVRCGYLKLRPSEDEYAYQEHQELFGKVKNGGPIIYINFIDDRKEVIRVLQYYRRQLTDYIDTHADLKLPEHVLAKQFVKEMRYGDKKDE